MNALVARIMEEPWVYRLWMAPFASQKLKPVLARIDLARVRRVLDVGCGPGTNTWIFSAADYIGVDINPNYIKSARRRHNRTFIEADVTTYQVNEGERFDLILINSLLHHLDEGATLRLLDHLKGLLTDDGRIHVLELVMPEAPSVARFLARHDRGPYAQSLEGWTALVSRTLEPVTVEPYRVRCFGVTLWNMVHYVGRAK